MGRSALVAWVRCRQAQHWAGMRCQPTTGEDGAGEAVRQLPTVAIPEWLSESFRAAAESCLGHRVRGWDRAETSRGAGDPGAAQRPGHLVPVAIADFEGELYLVSMLGANVNWVRNLNAAGGRAVLRHGRRESVHLEEVEPGARAPILRRYLQVAPGARPHITVDRTAPLTEFARIAADYPVFRIRDAGKNRVGAPNERDVYEVLSGQVVSSGGAYSVGGTVGSMAVAVPRPGRAVVSRSSRRARPRCG